MEESDKKDAGLEQDIKGYEQACNMIRHYSNCSFTIRTITVVQGILLVSAWLLSYQKEIHIPVGRILIPIIGILLTSFLCLFYISYYIATKLFYEMAEKMEAKLFDEDFRPMTLYIKDRKKRYDNNLLKRLFYLNAPFSLTTIMFVVILLISLLKS